MYEKCSNLIKRDLNNINRNFSVVDLEKVFVYWVIFRSNLLEKLWKVTTY